MTTGEIPVQPADKPRLAAMVRDYVTEMAAIIEGVDPRLPYEGFDLYWSDVDSRWPFWLTVDDVRVGFALLDREDSGRMQMAEFFIAPPFRRQGIGLAAARRLIARFPGPWKITQREQNAGAIAFWRCVLDGFVAYDEATTRTDAVRHQQLFDYSSPLA